MLIRPNVGFRPTRPQYDAGRTFEPIVWVPNGTPQDVIAKLNAAAVDALADPQVRARLAQAGQSIVPREQQTPDALAAHHKAEIEKWWPIIRAAGIKPE